MKLIATILVMFGFAFNMQAQEIIFEGVTYKVKGKTIWQDNLDVTNTLTAEKQISILEALEQQKAINRERAEAEKAIKKAEKKMRDAEKKQKKAEKELKQKERAHDKFEDANKDYEDAVKKYEKLKRKGKLSPNDEAKMLKKIDDLKEDIKKAKRKL